MAAVQLELDPDTILRDVPADQPRYEDGWDDTYESKFENALEEMDEETIEVILDILGVDDDPADSLSAILSEQSKSVLLYTLYRYISDKRTLLREMAGRLGEDVDEGGEYRYLLNALSTNNTDFVYQLLLYKEWSDARNERSYTIENELPDDYVERFDDNFRSIQLTLARRTNTDLFKYEQRNELAFENSTIFAIDRQTSDRERRDVVGAQRRRNLRSVFVEVKDEDETIHITTNNQTIRETLIEKLEGIFSISLISQDEVEDQIAVHADRFEEALRQLPEGDEEESNIRILNVGFRRTQTTPTVPLTVSKKSYDTEVRRVVSELSEDIISPDITNVRRFWFNVYGIDTRVNVEISTEDDTLRLDTDIKSDSGSLAERIQNAFQENFGLPLDQEIPLHWVTGDREQVISFILKNPPTYETQNNHYQDLIDDLDELGVINTEIVERKQCRGRECESIYEGREGDTCPACGGTLDVFAEFEKVSLSNRGILEFFKDRLADADIEYLGTKPEQIYRNKYRFRRVRHNGDIVHVLINTPDTTITPNTIKHLNKSLNPVTLLNPGTVKNQQLMDEVLATYLDLSVLIDKHLADDLESDYLTEKIDQVTRATEERVARNAADAYDRLQSIVANPSEYEGEDFEPEVFHLINQIITNAEQWGTKRRGNLPDGFAELLFTTVQGNYFRSFGWDCKFTSSDEFHIGASEAKDLRDYVHRIKESSDVTSSDTKFRNFVVITNAKSGNFGSSVADRINKMTSWDGTPVLMHIDFLFGLHLAFNQNVGPIKRNIQEFYKQFYLLLNDGKYYHREVDNDFYVDLTAQDAKNLFENFEAEIETSSLDISSLREFMEQDIFP